MRSVLLVVADVELQIMIHYDECDKVFGSNIVSSCLLQMLVRQTIHPENNDSERQNIVPNVL